MTFGEFEDFKKHTIQQEIPSTTHETVIEPITTSEEKKGNEVDFMIETENETKPNEIKPVEEFSGLKKKNSTPIQSFLCSMKTDSR